MPDRDRERQYSSRVAGKRILDFLDHHLALIFILPTLLILGGICVYPVLYSVWLSFTDYHLIYGISKHFTLENYFNFFSDALMWSALWNTVLWTAGNLLFQFVLAMGVALLLDQPIKGKRIWEMLVIIPWAFSTFGYVFTWKWMLDPVYGAINYFLIWFHLIPVPISWLGSKSLALPSVIAIGIWNGFPFLVVTFVAGLQTIPQEDYDVAHIEGASFPQIFRYVIIPRLRRILGIVVILKFIWYFNNFDLIFLATGGGPLKVTETFPIYTYRKTWDEMFVGRGATSTMLLLALLIVMSFVYFRLFKIEE